MLVVMHLTTSHRGLASHAAAQGSLVPGPLHPDGNMDVQADFTVII